jgi:hypothetical protein
MGHAPDLKLKLNPKQQEEEKGKGEALRLLGPLR